MKNGMAHSARGFTLVEVIFAFAILSVSLIALYELWGGGLKRADLTSKRTTAALIAQSILDNAQSLRNRGAVVSDGTAGIYSWHVTVSDFPTTITNSSLLWTPTEVDVAVSWTGRTALESAKFSAVVLMAKN